MGNEYQERLKHAAESTGAAGTLSDCLGLEIISTTDEIEGTLLDPIGKIAGEVLGTDIEDAVSLVIGSILGLIGGIFSD